MRREVPPPSEPGSCFYCGETFEALIVEHVVPLARGGTYDPWNLVRACVSCNSKKNDKVPSEWCPDHEKAVEIERRFSNILPRMRNGKLLDNRSWSYVRMLASCASFVNELKEQINSMPNRDPVMKRALTIWSKVDELRVHLIDHRVVLEARASEEGS